MQSPSTKHSALCFCGSADVSLQGLVWNSRTSAMSWIFSCLSISGVNIYMCASAGFSLILLQTCSSRVEAHVALWSSWSWMNLVEVWDAQNVSLHVLFDQKKSWKYHTIGSRQTQGDPWGGAKIWRGVWSVFWWWYYCPWWHCFVHFHFCN